MLDERGERARPQVQQEQLPLEEVAAVVAARADDEEGKRGVEGHRMHGVARTMKGSAGQIVGAVDADRRGAAGLVRACHRQQSATLVGDGEYGITGLGEGTVTEDPVDTEGHAGDLLNDHRGRAVRG